MAQPDLPCSVLIADNTAELRASIAALFPPETFRLVFAVNGRDALDKVAGQHFDMVVTGIVMSEFDGIELLGKLRKRKPSLPVVVIAEGAGDIDATYLRFAELRGAAATFSRPLDPLSFLRDVRAVLQHGCLGTVQGV